MLGFFIGALMTIALRHYCRHCRSKLAEPTDNPRRGFCTRGCFRSFYRSRCVVCETTFRRKNEQQKVCFAAKCKGELRRFPETYSWPEAHKPGNTPSDVRRAPETRTNGSLFGASRPTYRCLREWFWDGDGADDHSLYDKDGLTLARIVLDGGRYRLRHPITRPPLSWPGDDLDLAKHRAESIALNSLPLDPATAVRVAKENSKPHPLARDA
jgi:hypothetical protein